MVSQTEDFASSRAFRVAGAKAFAEAGITHNDVDHLMIYDAPCSPPGASFALLPIYGLEDLDFVGRGEAAPLLPSATPPSAVNADKHQWRRSLLQAFRHVRLVGERAPDARHCSRPNPRRQNLSLPRCGRHVRRLRHDHHVERESHEPWASERGPANPGFSLADGKIRLSFPLRAGTAGTERIAWPRSHSVSRRPARPFPEPLWGPRSLARRSCPWRTSAPLASSPAKLAPPCSWPVRGPPEAGRDGSSTLSRDSEPAPIPPCVHSGSA
jgi:hypothetical protein